MGGLQGDNVLAPHHRAASVLASLFTEGLVHYLPPIKLIEKDKHCRAWNQAVNAVENTKLKPELDISLGNWEKSVFCADPMVGKDTMSNWHCAAPAFV